MKTRDVIEIEAESYLEEQFLVETFPDAIWLNIHGTTKFYLSNVHIERVEEALNEWNRSVHI